MVYASCRTQKLKLSALDKNSTMTDFLREYLKCGNKIYMDTKIDITKYDIKNKSNYEQILMNIDKVSHNIAKRIALNNDIILKTLFVIYVCEGNNKNLI